MKSSASSKVFAIINPVAGTCKEEELVKTLKEKLGDRLVGTHITAKGDKFEKIVEEAKQSGADVVIAAGGDGTVSQVAHYLIGTPLELLIVPSGTANVMAKGLQLPFEPAKSLELIDNGTRVKFDAIEAGGKYFFSHVSVGLYSNIAHETPAKVKRIFGRLAYIWNGIRLIFREKNWHFKMQLDGGTPIQIKASTVMVANVGELGAAGLKWGPGIKPDDGVMNIAVIKSKAWYHYIQLAWEMIRMNRSPSQGKYYTFKNTLHLEPTAALPVRGDGEKVGQTPIEMKVLPGALTVIRAQPATAAT